MQYATFRPTLSSRPAAPGHTAGGHLAPPFREMCVWNLSPVLKCARCTARPRAWSFRVYPTTRACGMNVVLEAWASGTSVIVAATEGMQSYIAPGKNALTYEPGDPADLRQQLSRAVADPALREALAQCGRDTVRDHDLDRYVRHVHHLVTGATCGPSPVPVATSK
ncbi:MAG: glycosyltransferase [Dehalococcoidia bacterium]|nr:glycosyltransferase [Dehalococcoidia bacterium]